MSGSLSVSRFFLLVDKHVDFLRGLLLELARLLRELLFSLFQQVSPLLFGELLSLFRESPGLPP